MLSAIGDFGGSNPESHAAAAEYLEACNKIFERGILSHSKIMDLQSPALINIRSEFSYFQQWHRHLQETCPGVIYNLIAYNAMYVCMYVHVYIPKCYTTH